jgi:hypothetical protein
VRHAHARGERLAFEFSNLQSAQDASLNRLDEPTGEDIRRDDSFRVSPEGMDRTTVALTEELCRRFQLHGDRAAFGSGPATSGRFGS